MELVLLTALGVGGATVFGALIGFIFKKISHRFSDIVLSFAAGVMLAAAVLGLIIPSLEYGGKFGILITVAGIFAGAVCLNIIDKLVPHLHKFVGDEAESHNNANLSRVLLFVLAIAIHNLPEGIAAGVGACRRYQPSKDLHSCHDHGTRRGRGHANRLFCRQYFHGSFALCPCFCRRNDALCHQRRNDTRNTFARK